MADNKSLYFLSYSREEMYFAEMLVKYLKDAQLNIWFDLQQLEPGENWNAEINRGLSCMNGLVLVASKASLDSYYVGQEWIKAIQQDLPIYMIVFEEISFSPKISEEEFQKRMSEARTDDEIKQLKNLRQLQKWRNDLEAYEKKIVLDCRSEFDSKVKLLIQCLKGEIQTIPNDEIPELRRFGIRKMPPSVRFVMWLSFAMIVIPLLLLILGNLESAILPDERGFLANFVSAIVASIGQLILGYLFVYGWWRIMQRRFTMRTVYNMIAIGFLLSLLPSMVYLSEFPSLPTELIFLIPGILGLVQLYIVIFSNEWLRFAPRGAGRQERRFAANDYNKTRKEIEEKIKQEDKNKKIYPDGMNYDIVHEEADKHIAKQLSNGLETNGFKCSKESADYQFVIITNCTSTQLLKLSTSQNTDKDAKQEADCTEQAPSKDKPLHIGILASSINVNSEDYKTSALSNSQLFDFRRRQKSGLRAFTYYLRNSKSEQFVPYSPLLVPIDFRQAIAPWKITIFANLLRLYGFVCFVMALFILSPALTNTFSRFVSNDTETSFPLLSWAYVLSFSAVTLAYYVLAHILMTRRLTLRWFWLTLFGLQIGFIWLLMVILSGNNPDYTWLENIFDNSNAIIAIILGTLLTLPLLILWIFPTRNWLPSKSWKNRKDSENNSVGTPKFELITEDMKFQIGIILALFLYLFITSLF